MRTDVVEVVGSGSSAGGRTGLLGAAGSSVLRLPRACSANQVIVVMYSVASLAAVRYLSANSAAHPVCNKGAWIR